MTEAPNPPETCELVPPLEWPQQSPIDLGKSFHTKELPCLSFSYHLPVTGQFEGDENFHISAADRNKASLTFDGIVCPLLRLHFHSPAEHLINGVAADFEAHLVHEVPVSSLNPKPFSVALGIFFSKPKTHPAESVASVSKPKSLQESVAAQFFTKTGDDEHTYTFTPEVFLPKNSRHFYHYAGSLTTAPFVETVAWLVLRKHGKLDTAFETEAQGRTHHGPRKLQPLNRRFVLRNFKRI